MVGACGFEPQTATRVKAGQTVTYVTCDLKIPAFNPSAVGETIIKGISNIRNRAEVEQRVQTEFLSNIISLTSAVIIAGGAAD
jgi:hypothetical protein